MCFPTPKQNDLHLALRSGGVEVRLLNNVRSKVPSFVALVHGVRGPVWIRNTGFRHRLRSRPRSRARRKLCSLPAGLGLVIGLGFGLGLVLGIGFGLGLVIGLGFGLGLALGLGFGLGLDFLSFLGLGPCFFKSDLPFNDDCSNPRPGLLSCRLGFDFTTWRFLGKRRILQQVCLSFDLVPNQRLHHCAPARILAGGLGTGFQEKAKLEEVNVSVEDLASASRSNVSRARLCAA